MRSAEARLGVIESLNSAMQGAGRTWQLVSVPSKAVRWGVVAGGGVLGVLLFRGLFGRRKPAAAVLPVAASSSVGSSVWRLALQLLPVVLAPWLRSSAFSSGVGEALNRLQPSRLFFRWLGLER